MKEVNVKDLEIMAKVLNVPIYMLLDEIVLDELKKIKKRLDIPKK